MLFIDYLSDYTERRALGLAPRTIEAERYYISNYIRPVLPDINAEDIKVADILRVLTPPYSAGHTRTAVALWVYLSSACKQHPYLSEIMRKIPKPKHVTKDIKLLTPAQLKILLEESPEQYRLAWLLAGMYGLRRGEICGLQFRDVQLDGLHIERQRVTTETAGTIAAPLKSLASRRVLPLTPFFISRFEPVEILHLEQHGSDTDYIIPFTPHHLDHALSYCLQLLRLPHVSLHSLRHTAASLAVNSADAVNMRVLQSILGHSSIDTTARIYSHVSSSAQRAALDAIASNFCNNT